MRRKHFRRVLALVTALTVAIGLTVPAAYAASGFEDTKYDKGTIKVIAQKKGPDSEDPSKTVDLLPKTEGLNVKIYKVADASIVNGYVNYTLCPLFIPDEGWMGDRNPNDAKKAADKDASNEFWRSIAKQYSDYTVKKGFDTHADGKYEYEKEKGTYVKKENGSYKAQENVDYWTGKTGEDGTIKFVDLPRGLYLITIESFKYGRTTYTPIPIMRCLPTLTEDGKDWTNNIEYIINKIGTETEPGGGGGDTNYKTVTAMKVWKDDGQKSDRPESITVELLQNGEAINTKKLDKSNNWRYTWTGLSWGSTYTVNEISLSDKYTVSTDQEGNTWVITNTHTTDIDDPDTPLNPGPGPGGDPGTSGDIPPTNIDDPDVPLDPGQTPGDNATNIKDPSAPANAEKLPQTGQLWWPVPILAAAGIAFFSIGWLRSRKDESEENK